MICCSSLKFPMGGGNAVKKVLYFIPNQYINCSVVTGSCRTWEEHKCPGWRGESEMYLVYGLLICFLLLFAVSISGSSCSLTTCIRTSYILYNSQYLKLGQNVGSFDAVKKTKNQTTEIPNEVIGQRSKMGLKSALSLCCWQLCSVLVCLF